MSLRALQRELETIYEFTSPHDIEAFVITDARLAQILDRTPQARHTPEKLLLQQNGDDLDVSLYLDDGLLQRHLTHKAWEKLHENHLGDFWTVLEGVSHFLYLIYNARHRRSITRFEMELQAEVDKYITAAALFARQNNGRIPEHLHSTLFDDVRFADDLDEAELQRYRAANEYARTYCAALHDHFISNRSNRLATNEIRRFYRLLHAQKLSRIERLKLLH